MPYKSNAELPDSVKNNIPSHAQDIFRNAFNSAYEQYNGDEERCMKVAWAAVKNSYKQEGDKWVEKNLEKTFNIYFAMQKSFQLKKNNSEVYDAVKELEISKDIPVMFKNLDLMPGIYSYGIASTEDMDTEGEKVIIPDDVLKGLVIPPYNKIFINHKSDEDIASGTIEFAGRVPEYFGNDAVILERVNEAHPLFKSIVGSIANGNLDSYSAGGYAPPVMEYNHSTQRYDRIRKVQALHEVSRTSCPGNAGSRIKGMFFVKTKQGGFSYQEDETMDKEVLEKLNVFEKSLASVTEQVNALMEFKKTLETPKIEEPKKEDPKPEEKKPEDQKPAEDGELKKALKKVGDLEKENSELKKSLEPRKGVTKTDPEPVKKDDCMLMKFMKNPSRKVLVE